MPLQMIKGSFNPRLWLVLPTLYEQGNEKEKYIDFVVFFVRGFILMGEVVGLRTF